MSRGEGGAVGELVAALARTRATGPIGHSTAAHAVHGWCSLCPGVTPLAELEAWRALVQVEGVISARAAEVEGPRSSTVVLDFDGPLHAYTDGWRDGSIYGGPTEGAAEALQWFLERYAVVVSTARPDLADVAAAIHRWFNVQTITDTPAGRCDFWQARGVVLVTHRKMPALCYVDDRAVVFDPAAGWAPVLHGVEAVYGDAAVPGAPVIRPVNR